MNPPACTLSLVLPELFQTILINVLLMYAVIQQAPGRAKPGKALQLQGPNQGNARPTRVTPQITALCRPVLATEPVTKLMILGLATSALLYVNNPLPGRGYGLVWDDLAQFMSVALIASAIAALSLSVASYARFGRYEFTLLLWLSLLGMLSLIKSSSFLAYYLSIELQSLSFYMLAAMRSRNEASAEAGLKYFILSAFASAMLLLGMALVYGATGAMDFADIGLLTSAPANCGVNLTSVELGFGCIAVSLLFKLGAAPYHAWIADVYEGSATPVTAWFAITAKFAVITALLRVLSLINLHSLMVAAASLSLVVGSLSAARQIKLKRLLAFSAVANSGWFLLAFSAGLWQLGLIHLLVYTLLSINLFCVSVMPLTRAHPGLAYRTRLLVGPTAKTVASDHGADSGALKYISDLHMVMRSNPALAISLALSLFSLAGVPPLAGFYSKYLILNGLAQAESYPLLLLSLAVAVLSAYYYLALVRVCYFGHGAADRNDAAFSLNPGPWAAYVASLSCVVSSCWFLKPAYFCSHLNLI
jgi:NADH-quinone oxidoreductase subunit N